METTFPVGSNTPVQNVQTNSSNQDNLGKENLVKESLEKSNLVKDSLVKDNLVCNNLTNENIKEIDAVGIKAGVQVGRVSSKPRTPNTCARDANKTNTMNAQTSIKKVAYNNAMNDTSFLGIERDMIFSHLFFLNTNRCKVADPV